MKPIYIPVSVEKELPKEDKEHDGYSIKIIAIDKVGEHIEGCFGLHTRQFYPSHNGFEYVTHWLKPITSLSELPDEWKEAIRELAWKCFDAGCDYEPSKWGDTDLNKQEHLNQLLK